jgi:hypothetical protein
MGPSGLTFYTATTTHWILYSEVRQGLLKIAGVNEDDWTAVLLQVKFSCFSNMFRI